jgi:hypothetical protein
MLVNTRLQHPRRKPSSVTAYLESSCISIIIYFCRAVPLTAVIEENCMNRNKIFSGYKLCQLVKSHRCFRDHLCPHHQGCNDHTYTNRPWFSLIVLYVCLYTGLSMKRVNVSELQLVKLLSSLLNYMPTWLAVLCKKISRLNLWILRYSYWWEVNPLQSRLLQHVHTWFTVPDSAESIFQTQFLESPTASLLQCVQLCLPHEKVAGSHICWVDCLSSVMPCLAENCHISWAEWEGALLWWIFHLPDSHFCGHLWCCVSYRHLNACKS